MRQDVKILKLAVEAGYARVQEVDVPGEKKQLLVEFDKEKVFDEAKRRGLVPRRMFSGVPGYGVSRSKAAFDALQRATKRAEVLLGKEFGTVAGFQLRKTFQPCPRPLALLDRKFCGPFSRNQKKKYVPSFFWPTVDFYWKRARLGLIVLGPRVDDFSSLETRKRRNHGSVIFQEKSIPFPLGINVMVVPYYMVMKQPKKFLARVRKALVESGAYSKLREANQT